MKKYIWGFVTSFALAASPMIYGATDVDSNTSAGHAGHQHAAPSRQLSAEYKSDLEREFTARSENIGLLIVSHGSGSPSWTKLLDDICAEVRELDAEAKAFKAIETCDMEFNPENDMVAGFRRLETAGCDSVVVVPAFIYPTSHVQFDVVTILGMYGDPKAREAVHEEGARILRTKLPIALAPTLSAGDLMKDYVVSEAKKTSVDPKNERLLVIAHGDEDYEGLVDRLTKSSLDAAAEIGFDAVDSAFCEMGQTFAKKVKPIIKKNTEDGKKTVVVAIYLASSAKSFLERMNSSKNPFKPASAADGSNPNSLEGLNYVGSETPLGRFEGTAQYIYDVAKESSLN